MPDVRPFRAVRYDTARAGPLGDLVAAPYDVIGSVQRAEYLARSPYNVVHLTLPEDEGHAARLWADWRREGVLVEDSVPAAWLLAQDYVGPDGVRRERRGLIASLRAEPYETRAVRPHERTHAGPKEGRLRLLRAVGAHVEPIFLLSDELRLPEPSGDPDLRVEHDGVTNSLWRQDGVPPGTDAPLLIADGHHRYETAVNFAAEGGSPYLMVVIVPTAQEGLTIFPTHRIVGRLGAVAGEAVPEGPQAALERIAALPREQPAVVLYRDGRAYLVRGEVDELDAAFLERFSPQDVRYTPSIDEAVAAVDDGEADGAFLLRPPMIEQVEAVAEAGEVMPQKSTYFYPKLHSGLLFHPL